MVDSAGLSAAEMQVIEPALASYEKSVKQWERAHAETVDAFAKLGGPEGTMLAVLLPPMPVEVGTELGRVMAEQASKLLGREFNPADAASVTKRLNERCQLSTEYWKLLVVQTKEGTSNFSASSAMLKSRDDIKIDPVSKSIEFDPVESGGSLMKADGLFAHRYDHLFAFEDPH